MSQLITMTDKLIKELYNHIKNDCSDNSCCIRHVLENLNLEKNTSAETDAMNKKNTLDKSDFYED